MRVSLVVSLAVAAFLLPLRASRALDDGLKYRQHTIDRSKVGVDIVPPATPKIDVARITRGWVPAPSKDGQSAWYGGEGTGHVLFRIKALADNDTAPDHIGLRIVALDSTSRLVPKPGMSGDFRPSYVPAQGTWRYDLEWYDDSTEHQEPLKERLLFYAVDEAGNLSAAPDTVDVVDPGRP